MDVKSVIGSKNAFTALRHEGKVVAWGNAGQIAGWQTVYAASNVSSVVATERAFACVTFSGAVVTFGVSTSGANTGSSAATYLSSKVKYVVATAGAFAALRSDGMCVVHYC